MYFVLTITLLCSINIVFAQPTGKCNAQEIAKFKMSPAECCRATIINTKPYQDICYGYRTVNLFPQTNLGAKVPEVNPCYYECMWNSSMVWNPNADILYMDRMAELIQKSYHNDKETIDAVNKLTKECSENAYNLLKTWKEREMIRSPYFIPHQTIQCSWIPFVVIVCVERGLHNSCPEQHRTVSKDCETILEVGNDCLPENTQRPLHGLKIQ